MKEARIEVFGRVQGVGFRNSVKKLADDLGVTGNIMNLRRGNVMIVAQADKVVLDDFISLLKKNPGFSRVEKVDADFGELVRKYDDFKILKDGFILIDKFRAIINFFRRYFRGRKEFRFPNHIVLIPDGNRRWASLRKRDSHLGHYRASSYSNIKELVEEARKFGVKIFSFWAFSTENWNRSEQEKRAIFE